MYICVTYGQHVPHNQYDRIVTNSFCRSSTFALSGLVIETGRRFQHPRWTECVLKRNGFLKVAVSTNPSLALRTLHACAHPKLVPCYRSRRTWAFFPSTSLEKRHSHKNYVAEMHSHCKHDLTFDADVQRGHSNQLTGSALEIDILSLLVQLL